MKKRFGALLMTAIVAISFAGCSSSNDSASSEKHLHHQQPLYHQEVLLQQHSQKSLSRLYALLKPVVIQTTIQEYLHSIFQNI